MRPILETRAISTRAYNAGVYFITVMHTPDGDHTDIYARCERCGEFHKIGYYSPYYERWIIGEYSNLMGYRRHTYSASLLYEEEFICDECLCDAYAEREVFRCDDCGRLVWDDERHESVNGIICDTCAEEYSTCDECGQLTDNITYINGIDCYVCDECRDNYNYCDNCYEYFDDDSYDFDREACKECARGMSVIGSYHTARRRGFQTFGRTLYLAGIELEVERGQSETPLEECARACVDIMNADGKRVAMEYDSSLQNGFEMVFSPHTREAWSASNYREVLRYLRARGYTSHDNGRCGLHIHFDRRIWSSDEQIANMVNAVCENFDSLYRVARRQSERWCRRNDRQDGEIYKGSAMDKYKKCVDDCDRYTAVNLTNHNTIEFRLGRGTLNEQSFNAWYSICWSFVLMSRVLPMECTDIALWCAMIDENARAYCVSRGVHIWSMF